MAAESNAYNSVWQLRADAWCGLEGAADHLARLAGAGQPTGKH